MIFTQAEEAAIQEAVPAYRAAARHIEYVTHGYKRPNGAFRGETADDVLLRHGITLGPVLSDRHYGEIVAEIQRRANVPKGRKPLSPERRSEIGRMGAAAAFARRGGA